MVGTIKLFIHGAGRWVEIDLLLLLVVVVVVVVVESSTVILFYCKFSRVYFSRVTL